MTKSELIQMLSRHHPTLPARDVERAVNTLLRQITQTLAKGGRVEVRGFGSFSLHRRPPRRGYNPRNGEHITIDSRNRVHFKPAKELRERVRDGADTQDRSSRG